MLNTTIKLSRISLGNVSTAAVLPHLAMRQAAFVALPTAYNWNLLESCMFLYQQTFFAYSETLAQAVADYAARCDEPEERESDGHDRNFERNHC